MFARVRMPLCVGVFTLLVAKAAVATPTAATAATATPATPVKSGSAAAPVGAPAAADEDKSPKHRVAIMIAPLYLLLPIARTTAEVAIVPRVSLALTASVGQITLVTDEDEGEVKRRIDTWQAGGQVNVYLLGHFDHGMQLGVETLYTHLALSPDEGTSGQLDGWAAGPYLGYKFVAPFGLTVNGQLGFELGTVKVEGESDGDRLTRRQWVPVPILNLNLGWAF